MIFVAIITLAKWFFVASPVIGVSVAIATAVSDHRFNKALGR